LLYLYKIIGVDFLTSSLDKGSLTKSGSDDKDSAMASDVSSDCNIVKKGPEKRVKAKVKDSDDKGKALPIKKKKSAYASISSREDNKEVDGDGEKKVNEANVKWPASMPKKSKIGGDSDNAIRSTWTLRSL
jgi:hypothetical protein